MIWSENMTHIKSLVLKCRYIWLGIKSITQLNLGDRVIYQGRVYSLYQGIYNPKWHLSDVETHECLQFVHKNYFKKEISLRNVIWDIKHMYRFYMDYWHDIFMRTIPLSKCFVVDNSNWMEYKTE